MAGSIITSASLLLGSVNPDTLSENFWRRRLEYNAFGQNKLAAYIPDRTFVRFPYIVDSENVPIAGRLEQYAQSGVLLWAEGLTGISRGVAVDSRNGDIVAATFADENDNTLHKFDKDGNHKWSIEGFQSPRAVTVSSDDGSIFVCGIGAPPVKYDENGNEVFVADPIAVFDSEDDYASVAVDPTDNSFVVTVYRTTVDSRAGVIRYNANGTIAWEDADMIGYSVAIDPDTRAIYAVGVGEPTFDAPSTRKYTPAGSIDWSWMSNDHYVDVEFDPDENAIYLIGLRSVASSPFYALVKITADGSSITQHFPQGVRGFSCIVLGAEPVLYPNDATVAEVLGTSATVNWRPVG